MTGFLPASAAASGVVDALQLLPCCLLCVSVGQTHAGRLASSQSGLISDAVQLETEFLLAVCWLRWRLSQLDASNTISIRAALDSPATVLMLVLEISKRRLLAYSYSTLEARA